MAREFMEPFYFKKMEGTPLDGVGVGYCGGPTGATTPDETDATNNNHHNSQQSSLHPNSTTSSSTTTTTTTTSNNMNNNNNTTTDMMDAMKRKWVLFQANLDTMLQGIGFPQPFNRRRTGEGSGGGGGPGTGGGDKESTALTTTDEKKRNHNDTTSSNPSRANAHHHQAQLHHRTGEAAATNSSSSTSPSDAAVVVQQEHIEMALLSQGELRLGVGHDFVLKQLSNPTWCDKCGDFIWGVYKQCLKCRRKFVFFFFLSSFHPTFLFPTSVTPLFFFLTFPTLKSSCECHFRSRVIFLVFSYAFLSFIIRSPYWIVRVLGAFILI